MKFKLANKKVVNFPEVGRYKLSFIGGFKVKNKGQFKITIRNNQANQKIECRIHKIGITSLIDFKKSVSCCDFKIEDSGNYTITFDNIDDLSINKSKLFLRELFFPRYINNENVEISIQKTIVGGLL